MKDITKGDSGHNVTEMRETRLSDLLTGDCTGNLRVISIADTTKKLSEGFQRLLLVIPTQDFVRQTRKARDSDLRIANFTDFAIIFAI